MRPADLPPAGVEVPVGREAVGGQHPEVAGDQFAEHLAAARRADQEHGQGGGHRDPQPGAGPALPPPGLVDVGRRPDDVGVGLGSDGLQRGGGPALEVAHRGGADGDAAQVAQQPGDAPLADAVGPAQQRGRGLDAGAVAGRDAGREFAARDAAAPGARQAVAAVLGDVRADGREFDDLMDERLGVVAGEGVAAVGAGRRPEFDDGVGGQDGAVVAGVAELAALGLAGRRLGRGGLDVGPIGRRRPGRVGGVLAEAGFELGDAGGEGGDLGGDRFEGAW